LLLRIFSIVTARSRPSFHNENCCEKGALLDNYYSRLSLDVSKLASLLDTINNINTLQDKQQDIVGRVYKYFLSKLFE